MQDSVQHIRFFPPLHTDDRTTWSDGQTSRPDETVAVGVRSIVVADAGTQTVSVLRRSDGHAAQVLSPPHPASEWGTTVASSGDVLAVLHKTRSGRAAAAVYKESAAGAYTLVQVLQEGAPEAVSWRHVAVTAAGVVVSRSSGAALLFPHDCSCSRMGRCDGSGQCQCGAGLSGVLGVNCAQCAAGAYWNGTSCAGGPCAAGCSGHGICGNGAECVCEVGYVGTRCQERAPCEALRRRLNIPFTCPSDAG